MAFKNEYLTEEEKQMMEVAEIENPAGTIKAFHQLIPDCWTIDRERKIALHYCGVEDRTEYFYQKVFVLFYKGFDKEHMITLIFENKNYKNDLEDELKKIYKVNLVLKKVLVKKIIPQTLSKEISDKELYGIIVEAFNMYGVDGEPNYIPNVKMFLEVEGEIIS